MSYGNSRFGFYLAADQLANPAILRNLVFTTERKIVMSEKQHVILGDEVPATPEPNPPVPQPKNEDCCGECGDACPCKE